VDKDAAERKWHACEKRWFQALATPGARAVRVSVWFAEDGTSMKDIEPAVAVRAVRVCAYAADGSRKRPPDGIDHGGMLAAGWHLMSCRDEVELLGAGADGNTFALTSKSAPNEAAEVVTLMSGSKEAAEALTSVEADLLAEAWKKACAKWPGLEERVKGGRGE